MRLCKLIPRLLHGITHRFERVVVADHDMSVFETFVVGQLGGDAGTDLFGREVALFRQSIDDDRL